MLTRIRHAETSEGSLRLEAVLHTTEQIHQRSANGDVAGNAHGLDRWEEYLC